MKAFLKRAGLLIGACSLVLAMGCGQSTDDDGENGGSNTEETITEGLTAEETALLEACEYLTPQMYERATAYPEGDLTRIAAAMRKALAGENVTVGVIGGSITQGSLASSSSKCYAALLEQWWKETFPESELTFVNAGVGGTSSYLGVHRVEKDLLSYNPDFVVVEFSVNDAETNFYKRSYDNLVYRLLNAESQPAVLLLFMTMEDGTSAQNNDSLIGFQYGIPMLSYRNAVLDEITAGSFTWKDISPDNIHPNDRGHAIVGEMLSVYLSAVYGRLDEIAEEKAPAPDTIITKELYQNATIENSQSLEPTEWGSFEKRDVNDRFGGNWTTQTGEESIHFTVEASNIGIMYQKFIDGNGGQYEVWVDGEKVATLDADFSGGWGNYGETTEVYVSEERTTHEVEIRKAEDSTGGAFSILGLMIS